MTLAFAYLRVSGKSQVDGDGFPRQALAISRHAAANDYEIVETFEERGVTGEMDGADRPAWSALIEKCRATNVSVIMFERLDRLARDLMVQETMLAQVKKIGILPVSTSEPDLASTDPTRVLIRQIMGGVAQWDKAQIVNKLRGARQRKRLQIGKCEGRKSYGEKDDEAETLIRICQCRLAGLTWQSITNWLNTEVPTRVVGRRWFPATVQKMAGGPRMMIALTILRPEIGDFQACFALPCCYAWRRGSEWLYVGSTMQLLTRLRSHNVIGKHEPLLDSDVLSVWPAAIEIAQSHEERLIRECSPKYNAVGSLQGEQAQAANFNRRVSKDPYSLASSLGISSRSLKALVDDDSDGRRRT